MTKSKVTSTINDGSSSRTLQHRRTWLSTWSPSSRHKEEDDDDSNKFFPNPNETEMEETSLLFHNNNINNITTTTNTNKQQQQQHTLTISSVVSDSIKYTSTKRGGGPGAGGQRRRQRYNNIASSSSSRLHRHPQKYNYYNISQKGLFFLIQLLLLILLSFLLAVNSIFSTIWFHDDSSTTITAALESSSSSSSSATVFTSLLKESSTTVTRNTTQQQISPSSSSSSLSSSSRRMIILSDLPQHEMTDQPLLRTAIIPPLKNTDSSPLSSTSFSNRIIIGTIETRTRTTTATIRKKDFTPLLLPLSEMKEQERRKLLIPDYGGIQYFPNNSNTSINSISIMKEKEEEEEMEDDGIDSTYEDYRNMLLQEMDRTSRKEDLYDVYFNEEDLQDEIQECYRPNWYHEQFLTCNRIHELSPLYESLLVSLSIRRDQFFKESSSSPTSNNNNTKSQTTPNTNAKKDITTTTQGVSAMYLGSGTYRDAWKYNRPSTRCNHDDNEDDEEWVIKRQLLNSDTGLATMVQTRNEANVMTHLSSSPYILNIYGYCGQSVMVEAMESSTTFQSIVVPEPGYISQKELTQWELSHHHGHGDNNDDDVHPHNNITIPQKLQWALDMARGLATLHGHPDGMIVHGDTHIEQWMLPISTTTTNNNNNKHNKGKTIRTVKLNDFNLARIMEFNLTSHQDYCPRMNRSYDSLYRSPEEYTGNSLDEQVDTYAFGNGIYSLLTGLWPFYAHPNPRRVRKMVQKGKLPFVDPRYRTRSYIEGKLVELMMRCWEYDRQKRIDIFTVVAFLQQLKSTAIERGMWIDGL